MTFTEERKDLFTVSKDYHLVHCIASDLGMSAGIAVPMKKKFNIIQKLKEAAQSHPACVKADRVFNLITKKRSGGKPTYKSLQTTLDMMKAQVLSGCIKKLAMPKIGCGLDRLSWPMVRDMIKSTFEDTDVEIKICSI